MEPIPDSATGVGRGAAGEPAILGTPAAARLVGVSPRPRTAFTLALIGVEWRPPLNDAPGDLPRAVPIIKSRTGGASPGTARTTVNPRSSG
jgi:hypothetical protein